MRRTTRSAIAAFAILAALTACGGAVESGPSDSGAAPADSMSIVLRLGFDGSDDAGVQAQSASDAGSAPLSCKERAVPPMCSKTDAPFYDAQSLEAAWIACGGTDGVANGCGVLSVSFDESGCVAIDFSGAVDGSGGAEPCLTAKLEAYRFECSAGSGIALNHLCN